MKKKKEERQKGRKDIPFLVLEKKILDCYLKKNRENYKRKEETRESEGKEVEEGERNTNI